MSKLSKNVVAPYSSQSEKSAERGLKPQIRAIKQVATTLNNDSVTYDSTQSELATFEIVEIAEISPTLDDIRAIFDRLQRYFSAV